MVLTHDGELYTEFLEYDVLQIEKKEGIDFESFDVKQHETEDYPLWLPISMAEAIDMEFAGQPYWLPRYLTEKQIDYSREPIALQA